MAARRLLVSGRVQGVWYRGWTVDTANRLGISGWVRNLRSGDVEIYAEGSAEALDALVEQCRKGPAAAIVTSIQILEASEEGTRGFVQHPSE